MCSKEYMELNTVLVLEALILILMATMLVVSRARWLQLTVAVFLLVGAGICAAMLISKENAQTVLSLSGVCAACRR